MCTRPTWARTSSRPCWPAPRPTRRARRRRDFRLRGHGRPVGGDRPHRVARGGPARGGARRHRGPAVSGSSQQAVHFAAQAVLSGTAGLVVAGGVQNMSMVPIGSAMTSDPFSGSEGWRNRYGAEEISQFRAADLIAAKWGIGRAEMERFALASHQRTRATGRRRLHPQDRALRRGNPGRGPPPRHHAGEDGRAEAAARGRPDHRGAVQPDLRRRGRPADRLGRRGRRHGLRPRARITHLSARGDDPC